MRALPDEYLTSLLLFNRCIALPAKHANDKAAKWARAKRPKKKRPSDIHRKPVVYELTSIEKPPEITVLEDE